LTDKPVNSLNDWPFVTLTWISDVTWDMSNLSYSKPHSITDRLSHRLLSTKNFSDFLSSDVSHIYKTLINSLMFFFSDELVVEL